MKIYKVAANTPFNNSILTYSSDVDWKVGELVKVPLGKSRFEKACILGEGEKDENFEIKQIFSSYEWEICLPKRHLEFLQWIANYYQYPLGQLIFDSLPKPMKRPRELGHSEGSKAPLVILSDNQKIISNKIKENLNYFNRYLIHGVTGSGKSMIYFDIINSVLDSGKSVLFLLPEINLTPQFLKSFSEHTKRKTYTYNSSLKNSDRFGLVNLLLNDTAPKIILGVRSGLFLPIQNLGLVVVDEEHDQSFKQEDRCPYNARDLSIKLSQLNDCPVVLGSATPSIETYFNFKKNNDQYFSLKERFGKSKLPTIEILDCRSNDFDERIWPFHSKSIEEISISLERNEQVLVFVNRLGYASFIQCRACGFQFYCPNCSVPLKYFKAKNEIRCQTCDYKDELPEICPDCGNMNLHQKGFGTEKLTEVLKKYFPKNTIERFDRDDIKTFNQLNERLDDFHQGKIDILVGTQMLSKGHNFENVNLVLILGIDSQLNFPDFRSSERAYQLLTQVSGRSGRFGKESKVAVQTMSPEMPLFEIVKNHKFDDFYSQEMPMREICDCPPFKKLVTIYITSKFQKQAQDTSIVLVNLLNNLRVHYKEVEVLGPRPGIIEKRANKYTWSILLKSKSPNELHQIVFNMKKSFKPHYSISIKVDIDPYTIS